MKKESQALRQAVATLIQEQARSAPTQPPYCCGGDDRGTDKRRGYRGG